MRYIDVCSGISAPTMAWKPLGWEALCFAEIEPFPRAVLAHHYPDVPLNGDFTKIEGTEYGPVDLLVGGTPCQSFSVAGLRGGLGDDRGNLALEYLRLADRARPRWLVWENVPGVLSSNGGRDFGAILGGMVELGYGIAYRVLDAQHFGVPQRRRRVFVVGYLGDWRRAAAVLFERHSLSGDTPPRRQAGERTAPGLSASTGGVSGKDAADARLILSADPSHCLNAGGMGRQDYETETLIAHSRDVAAALTSNYGKQPDSSDTALGPNLVAFTQNQRDEVREVPVVGALAAEPGMKQQTYIAFSAKDHGGDAQDNLSPTLRAGGHSGSHANAGVMPAVAFDWNNSAGAPNSEDSFGTLSTRRQMAAMQGSAVRRLTPGECEALQGFPRDFTLVPYRGKPAADGPRYKALGNSMAVPVARWIGERIAMVEALSVRERAA